MSLYYHQDLSSIVTAINAVTAAVQSLQSSVDYMADSLDGMKYDLYIVSQNTIPLTETVNVNVV